MTYRDSSHPEYSAEWHRQNPAAATCNGTGLISRVTTSIAAKAHVLPMLQAISTNLIKKELLDNIGELGKDDFALIGTVKTSDGSFFDLKTLSEQSDYVTFNTVNYVVRHVYDYATNEVVGQMALIKRKS